MMIKPFRNNRLLKLLVAWVILFWVITAIYPLYPRDWLLENLLVFIFGILLTVTYRRFQFSNFSYALFSVFISLHLYGAHYTYAETPFGFWLDDWLGFGRNHYDRIVHFCFGLLLAFPFREILIRAAKVVSTWSYFLSVVGIMGFSSFYEVIEGATAMIVSPELGSAYLGTQGDEWDAQKDSFLAFAGAVVAMLMNWWYFKRTSRDSLIAIP